MATQYDDDVQLKAGVYDKPAKPEFKLDKPYLIHVKHADFPRNKEGIVIGLKPMPPYAGQEQTHPNGRMEFIIEADVIEMPGLTLTKWLNWPWDYDNPNAAPYDVANGHPKQFSREQIGQFTKSLASDGTRISNLAKVAMAFGWKPFVVKQVPNPKLAGIPLTIPNPAVPIGTTPPPGVPSEIPNPALPVGIPLTVTIREPQSLALRSLVLDKWAYYTESKDSKGGISWSIEPVEVTKLTGAQFAQVIINKLAVLKQTMSTGDPFTEASVIAAVRSKGHFLSGDTFATLKPEEIEIVLSLLKQTCEGRKVELRQDYILPDAVVQAAMAPQAAPMTELQGL